MLAVLCIERRVDVSEWSGAKLRLTHVCAPCPCVLLRELRPGPFSGFSFQLHHFCVCVRARV